MITNRRCYQLLCLVWVATLAPAQTTFAKSTSPIPKESSIVETVKVEKDGNLTISFQVTSQYEMNWQAPWLLKLNDHKDLTFAKKRFKEPDTDKSLPGFVIRTQSPPSADAGEISYKLNAFVCTKDKTYCYRNPHERTLAWSTNKAAPKDGSKDQTKPTAAKKPR